MKKQQISGRQSKRTYRILKFPWYSLEIIRGDVYTSLSYNLLLNTQHQRSLYHKHWFKVHFIDLKLIIIDKLKLNRVKARIKITSHQNHVKNFKKFSFALVLIANSIRTFFHKRMVKKPTNCNGTENQWTFIKHWRKVSHRVVANIGVNGVLLAEDVVVFLEEFNSINNVKLHTFGCSLHHTEQHLGLFLIPLMKLLEAQHLLMVL